MNISRATVAALALIIAVTSPALAFNNHNIYKKKTIIHAIVRAKNSGHECGVASYYSLPGRRTASGERMNPGTLSAAHKFLPFGSKIRVTDQYSGNSVVVRVNDRGPFVRGRIVDLTPAAAHHLGMRGLSHVCIDSI